MAVVSSLLHRWPTMLVAAYAVAALSWSMPPEVFPPKPLIDRVARVPFTVFSLWHAWDMFSPDPRDIDVCVEVAFTEWDGARDRLMLTDMVAMGYVERWRKDRWRKFFNDNLRLDDNAWLWQPFAEYAVRRLRDDGYDPASIELVRWWRPCQRPVHPGLRADERQTPFSSNRFHAWQVPRGWDQ